jgi:hypothetical protein
MLHWKRKCLLKKFTEEREPIANKSGKNAKATIALCGARKLLEYIANTIGIAARAIAELRSGVFSNVFGK